jgi:hypothetical protein
LPDCMIGELNLSEMTTEVVDWPFNGFKANKRLRILLEPHSGMDYNIFYRDGGSYGGTVVTRPGVVMKGIPLTTEDIITRPLVNVATGSGIVGYVSTWLPVETNAKLWTALVGLTGVAMCYASYKVWEWIGDVRRNHGEIERERSSRYEYKYLEELDGLLQSALDDVENPDMAEVDTIKVGGSLMPLSLFKSFSRNMRKKMVRKAASEPIVKRVAVPASEFDWIGSYVDDMVPVGASRDPEEGKKVVMRYDPEAESFWWYCDNPSVQYKYLETVARKYVCDFNRVDVFVDIREELKKGEAESHKNHVAEEGGDVADASVHEKDVNRKKVYAKFKKYNKKAARANPAISGKHVVLKAKSNRYTYKGKLADYEKLVHVPRDDEVLINDSDVNSCGSAKKSKAENVSWSEWKIGNFEGWR